MKLQVLTIVLLGCVFYCAARSLLNDEPECPSSTYYDKTTGECKSTGRNAIQVPGRCPEGQSVAANKQCLPIWRKPPLPPLPPLNGINSENTTEQQPEEQK